MAREKWCCVVLLLVLLSALSPGQAKRRADGKQRARDLIAQYQSQFGMDMYWLMASNDNTSNIFFSPMSIGTALGIVYAGSGGDTAQQLATVLHFQGRKPNLMRAHRSLLRWNKRALKKGVTVQMTNRIYAAHSLRLRTKFSSFMERIFKADVTRMNFARSHQAARKINDNVKKDTAGNIDDLVQPSMLSGLTRMVIVNALYFKGDWLMKFDPEDTAPGDFHTPYGVKQVPMMRAKKKFPVGNLREMNARILRLPYKGEKVEMAILLPNERDGLSTLEAHLRNTSFTNLSWRAEAHSSVQVQLPKFQMTESINLKPVLQRLGLSDLFDSNLADLTGISRRGGLYVTDAVHRAKLEVSEEGTEASAATALVLGYRMLRPRPEPFIVDRPFVLAIRDTGTGSMLFMGRVMDPAP